MSKEEYVEVTLKIPKRLIDALEAEHYFGWSKQDFFIAAIKGHIGATLFAMPIEKDHKFHEKYGKDIDTYTLPESLEEAEAK